MPRKNSGNKHKLETLSLEPALIEELRTVHQVSFVEDLAGKLNQGGDLQGSAGLVVVDAYEAALAENAVLEHPATPQSVKDAFTPHTVEQLSLLAHQYGYIFPTVPPAAAPVPTTAPKKGFFAWLFS